MAKDFLPHSQWLLVTALLTLIGVVGRAGEHDVRAPTSTGVVVHFQPFVPGAAFSPNAFRGWDNLGTDADSAHAIFSADVAWDCSADETVNRHLAVASRLREHPRSDAWRTNYETHYGGIAARMLTEALRAGNPTALASVAVRFRFTEAGNRAAAMAVLAAADRGYDLSAAYLFHGWFLDNADHFCDKKALHPFVQKGLSLLKATGLDVEYDFVNERTKACATFPSGQASTETSDKSTPSGLKKEWFEKPNETVKAVETRRNLLKLALTYGATGPRASQLFKAEPRFTFCDHYDLAFSYPSLFEKEQTFDIRAMQALYPVTTLALNSEVKAGVLKKFLAEDFISDDLIELAGLIGKVAVPDLTAALSNGVYAHKTNALWGLARIGPEAESAVPAVAALAESNSGDLVPAVAMQTLAALGRAGSVELVRILKKDPKRGYHLRICHTLSPEVLALMVENFDEATRSEKEGTLLALLRNGKTAAFATDKLIEVLDSDDLLLQEYAIGTLSAIGPPAEKAVPKLIKMLQDSDPRKHFTGTIFSALASIGPKAGPAMEVVLPYLEESNGNGDWAERVLSAMGPRVIPALQSILKGQRQGKTKNEIERLRMAEQRAISALRGLGSPGVPVLTETLSHKIPDNAQHAVDSLGALGAAAAPAIPEIYSALLNSESISPIRAGEALGKIGEAAKPTIVEAFASQNARGRKGALHALRQFAKDPTFALPLLARGLKDEDPTVREEALANFRGLHVLPDGELPTVVSLAADNSVRVRVVAYGALEHIPRKESALALGKGVLESEEYVRAVAYYGLSQMGGFAEAALPAVTDRLSSEDPTHRIEAATYLARHGEQTVRAPLEKQLAKETEPGVREILRILLNELELRKPQK